MIGAGIVAGAGLLGAGLGLWGASRQERAARAASRAQIAETRAAREAAMRTGREASGIIGQYGTIAGQHLLEGGERAAGAIGTGLEAGTGALTQYGGAAERALQSGYGGALGAYGAGAERARAGLGMGLGAYGAGSTAAMRGLGGYASGLGDAYGRMSHQEQLMADPGGYMAQDPGYQFRLGEGTKAVERAMAAHGGRASPAAMQEYGRMAQGLASQEFGAAASRAQAADAARLAVMGQQTGLQSQLAGMGMQRAGGLADMYGRMSGLEMQAGAGLAGLQQARGTALAAQQTGLGTNLANMQMGAASQLGSLYSSQGANLAQLVQGIGQGRAAALTGAAQQGTQLTAAGLPAFAGAVPYAGAMQGAAGQGIANIGRDVGQMIMLNQMYGGRPETFYL